MDMQAMTQKCDNAKNVSEALFERYQNGTSSQKALVVRELAKAPVPVVFNFCYLLSRIDPYPNTTHQSVLVQLIEALEPAPSEVVDLDKRRRYVAEDWYSHSDLNGDQVIGSNGWESGDSPDELKQTLYVEPDTGEGPSIKKVLRVKFAHTEALIIAAYLPGTNFGQEFEVEGSADWNKCRACEQGIENYSNVSVCPHCGCDLSRP